MQISIPEETKTRNHSFARLAHDIVVLCGEKFQNPDTQTKPDFMLSCLIGEEGVTQGYYLPILNHWGISQYNYFTWGCGGFVLPWTHQDTWQFLMGNNREVPKTLLLQQCESWKAIVGGVRAGQIFFVQSPDQLEKLPVISGGTRKGKELLERRMHSRQDSPALSHDANNCPFCKSEKGEVRFGAPGMLFKVMEAKFSPHSWHKIIVPAPEFVLEHGACAYDLYGPAFLKEVLDIACWYTLSRPQKNNPVQLGVHIGSFAGQNVGHMHFHMLQD